MKVLSSLKSAKARHRDCKVVRRRGKVFVICKSNPRFKARHHQGEGGDGQNGTDHGVSSGNARSGLSRDCMQRLHCPWGAGTAR